MTLRVATLNIWNRMGPWEERLAAIRAELPGLAADILALQEVIVLDDGSFDQGALVAEGHGYHVVYGRHEEGIYPMGNAILSRWPFGRTKIMPLPRGGTDEHRSLVFAEVLAPFGKVPVFCTHLNWKLDEGHVRTEQIRFVTDRIAELVPPNADYPPILLGDFNADPDADEIRFLRGLTGLGGRCVYFADTFGIVGKGNGTTYARRNPFAAPIREPDRRIDYIFVRGPDEQGRGEPLEARICFDAPHEGTFASDHFGIVCDLSLK